MELSEAKSIAEQLIMTQHRDWRPKGFVITDQYFSWGEATMTTSSAPQQPQTTFYNSGSERFYFNRLSNAELYSWKRKFFQWYAVELIDNNGDGVKYVLRTKSLEDARQMVDAVNTILASKK